MIEGKSLTATMKQALEALETTWYHVGTFAPTDDAIELYDQARTSLRQAISELEQRSIAELESQEPVAWEHDCAALLQNNVELWIDRCPHCGKPRTTHPPQPAKPIPCANHCEATAFEIVIKNLQGEIERLKAPQRTWVGLTKEDKDLIEDLCEMMIGDAVFSTIDAILKGKNT